MRFKIFGELGFKEKKLRRKFVPVKRITSFGGGRSNTKEKVFKVPSFSKMSI